MLEDKLLQHCAQVNLTDSTKNWLEKAQINNLDWPYILKQSRNQGVCSLVYLNLSGFKHKIPENIWRSFEQVYYGDSYRNTQIYQKISVMFIVFNREDLKVIPLKGIFFLENIYKNIGLRSMYDVDLLVKKEDLERVDKILVNLGYKTVVDKRLFWQALEKSYMNSVDYFREDEEFPPIHIHWHIINVSLPTYMYSKRIKMDKFFACARRVILADAESLQLAPQHLIMYMAEHALKHSFNKLIHLSDIDAVIKKYKDQIDWDGLVAETIEFGMERQVYYSLFFTRIYLGSYVPEYVLSSLRPNKIGFLEKKFFNSIKNNKRNSKLCYFVYLNMVKGAKNKFRFIFRTLFPPPSILALTFNLNKPKVTLKDYLLFLRKQLFHLKRTILGS